MSRLLTCPHCHDSSPDSFLALGMGSYVKCQLCSFTFCKLTGREWKAAHDPKAYKFAFIQDSIRELESHYDKDKVVQCPGCGFPRVNEKDEDACVCPTCHTSFCLRCSAPTIPILSHGPSYHRPSCPLFTQAPSPPCPACSSSSPCPQPQNLQTPLRFTMLEL